MQEPPSAESHIAVIMGPQTMGPGRQSIVDGFRDRSITQRLDGRGRNKCIKLRSRSRTSQNSPQHSNSHSFQQYFPLVTRFTYLQIIPINKTRDTHPLTMRYATLLALATSAAALPVDLPVVGDLTKGLPIGSLTKGVGMKRNSIDCSLESSIGLLECNDIDVPVDATVLARNTKIECEIDGVISAANCNDIDIPVNADVLKRSGGHGPPTHGGDSIDCSLESSIGLVECNDIDVPVDVSILKRRGASLPLIDDLTKKSDGHGAPAAGDEIECEIDGALVSAVNCNDIDIPVNVDVAKRSDDEWVEAEAPAPKPSKKGSSNKKPEEDEEAETESEEDIEWEEAEAPAPKPSKKGSPKQKPEPEAEEEETTIECESDGLVSLLNCNDIDVPVDVSLLRS
jgi:hypothetical protein